MRLAFMVLAHDDADNVLRLIARLLRDGDCVVVHWDKHNPFDLQAAARQQFNDDAWSRLFFAPRLAVKWGQWPMVEATLACMDVLASSRQTFAYVLLLSGADYPIKPLGALKAFLAQDDGMEYIECVDPSQDAWVVQGLVHERYQQYHWINWRDHPKLFNVAVGLQKALRIKRKLPEPLKPRFGSQWWALTWPTAQRVLQLGRDRAICGFFKTTWVPDELFFQTLVASVVPPEKISGRNLTFYHFTRYGRPLVFYNGHFDFLTQQGHFFARKLSPHATDLRGQLDAFIDNPRAAVKPMNGLVKRVADYENFFAVQWRGLPGRRVIGRQLDTWYGDLEWNKRPYFVVVCHHDVRLGALRQALNNLPGIRCYGELFRDGSIDYGLVGKEHPLYPKQKTALRDAKRPNFLADVLQANPEHIVGFVLRIPSSNEMEKLVIYDPQATLIYILPDDNYLENNVINMKKAFSNMVLHDNLAETRRAAKPFLALVSQHDFLTAETVKRIAGHIAGLSTEFTC
jgi:hypothetical protein